MASPILKSSALQTSTAIAAEFMEEIQAIVNSAWNIDTTIGGGTLSGTPNNLEYDYEKEYSESGTIIPGVPAYTITEEYVIPAVVIPAVPGWGTANACSFYGGKCTSEIPGTPAITTTPAVTIPAVVSPAVPALTGGYSTELDISASVVGISEALEPLFSSITFKGGSMTDPNSDGLATETVTYNLNQSFAGTALQISGRAAFDDLTVDIGGSDTNLGNVSTGTLDMSNVPNVPIEFDAVVVIPSFNDSSDIINTVDGVSYELFPQTNDVYINDLEISTGVTAVADFIDDSLLSYLTDFWNARVVPLYTAVGANAPEAPSQSLSDEINNSAAGLQQTVNKEGESGVNSILDSTLSTTQPYIQALTAAVWDYSTYPILPGGNYANAIMTSGLFSGVDASNASFVNSDLSGADFSGANLSGTDFSGANISGADFSGASGAPSSKARRSKRSSTETNFTGAVAFGTDFTGSPYDISGAYTDKNTKTGDLDTENTKFFSAATLVAGNGKLRRAYGLDYENAKGHFIFDGNYKGKKPSNPGLRTEVENGDLSLTKFNADKYMQGLPQKIKDKITKYQSSGNQAHTVDELVAIHKIASKTKWSDHDSAEYLTANPKLIKKLGGSEDAMKKAKANYLTKGIFKDKDLKPAIEDIHDYVEKYPQIVGESGGTIDPASISYNHLTVGYDQGLTF